MITEMSVNNIMTNEILSKENLEKIGNDSLHCSTYWCGLALGTQQVTRRKAVKLAMRILANTKRTTQGMALAATTRNKIDAVKINITRLKGANTMQARLYH